MPRKTITIAEVAEPRERQGKNGPYHILDVKDSEGRKYSCLKSSLFAHFKAGESLDCDVKEEQREYDGNQFTSRTITDVFVEGQSVGAQKQQGRSYGKPMENVQYERASIEFNNAMSEAGLGVREGKAPQDIEATYWGHLRRLLAAQPNASLEKPLIPHPTGQEGASAPKPIQSGIPQPRTPLDDAEDMDKAFAGTVATDTGPPFANRGAFLTAAYQKWGLGPSEVGAIITTADMQDPTKAWQKLVKIKGAE